MPPLTIYSLLPDEGLYLGDPLDLRVESTTRGSSWQRRFLRADPAEEPFRVEEYALCHGGDRGTLCGTSYPCACIDPSFCPAGEGKAAYLGQR